MALQDILKDIERTTEIRISEIRKNCSEQVRNIEEDLERTMEDMGREFSKRLQEEVSLKTIREKDSIAMETSAMILGRRTEIIRQATEKLSRMATEIRKTGKYGDILQQSVKIASALLGDGFTMKYSPEDEGEIRKIQVTFKGEKDREIMGGILCISKDGERVIDLRVEKIFQEILPDLQLYVSRNIGVE